MITVIGGSGFIGSRLCTQFKNNNIDFRIVDKKKSELYPEHWLFGDVTKPESLIEPLKGCSVIINLAAEHKDNVDPVSLYYDVNVDGAQHVCDVAEQLGINHIVFTSSVAVYGFVNKETGEEGEYHPFNDYGKSKLAAEHIYDTWQGQDNTNRALVTIRPTVVFGEKNRGNVYNLFRQIASGRFLMIGKGDNKKSMAYVENVAAFLRFATSFKPGHYVYNYVDKPDYTMDELTDVISEALGKHKANVHVPYFIGLIGGYCFDFLAKITGKKFVVSSIRIKKFCARTQFKSNRIHETGFEPPVSLQKGIANTVQYEFK